jgi:hypothetical protein
VCVTPGELERRLRDAAHARRGLVHPADLKTYTLPMRYMKSISEPHDWAWAQALAGFADQLPLRAEVDADSHRGAEPTDAHRREVPTGCAAVSRSAVGP